MDVVFLSVKGERHRGRAGAARSGVGPDTRWSRCRTASRAWSSSTACSVAGHALGGAAYIFAVIEEPGVIAHRLLGRIAFGELGRPTHARAERVLAALTTAKIPVDLSPDIRRVMWEKYLLICARRA
jgi:2-dehydropantoate 2-reductase